LFDDARVTASIEKEAIKVKELSVRSGKGTLDVSTDLFYGDTAGESKADIRFSHFPVNNRTLHGSIDIKGTLSKKNGWQFAGTCQTGKFQYDRWSAQKIRSFLAVTAGRIDLKGLQVDSFLNGNLSFLYEQKMIDSTLLLHRLPLSMLLSGLQGHASGTAVIKGAMHNPDIALNITAPDGRYNEVPFTIGGKFVHKNNEVYCSDLALSSGDSRVTASGRLLPRLAVTAAVKDFSLAIAEKSLKTSIPVRGLFSGTADITGTFSDPKVTAELAGRAVSLDSLQFSECKTKLSASRDAVDLSYMSLKFSDSELKLQPESIIDLKKRTFALHSEWRNIHAGPADLFGALLFKGSWSNERNTPLINGTITTGNFWLNQHVLDKTTIAVSFNNHVLTFLPQNDQKLKLEGAIDLRAWPELSFKQWQIRHGNRSLTLQGILGDQRWDFNVAGRLIDSETLSELLNLSFGIEGDIDLTVIGKGSVDHPQIEGSLSAANGAIANVPFDSVNLQISARQDVLTISNARLVKKDQYTVIAMGYTPFFLNDSGKKRVLNRPLDLTVTIEEGTLNLLKGISSDIVSADGNLRAQARLSGTLSKPVGNGFVRISNGMINAKRYFSKLSGLTVDLLWKDNLLTIKDFNGRIGDGRVRMKGGLVLQGLSLKTVNVAFFTDGSRGVPIFVPELPIPSPLIKSDEWQLFSNSSHGTPRFNVQLSGPGDNMLLSGWVELENTHFSYPPPATAEAADGDVLMDAIWPRISWDLELRSGKNTWYDNELVNVSIMGGIRLSGKGAFPSVDGKVESVRGTITYIGREFTIRQALLEINHDSVFVEGEAETEVNGKNSSDSDVIRMYIDKSKIENLKPRFVSKSDPEMTPEKALAKATGVDPENYSNVDQDFIMRQQLIRLIDSTLTTPLARNLLSRSGLADSFRVKYINQEAIKPAIPGSPTLTELLYGTKYSVEKHLTNQILFGYSVTFDQAQNRLDLRHELELSYRLQKNTFLTGSYELESKYNTLRQPDRRITLEQQWRFGWTPKKK
jgi:translocation and assembly module TamB